MANRKTRAGRGTKKTARPRRSAPTERPAPVPVEVRASDGWPIHGKIHGAGPLMLLCNGMVCTTHYWPLWVRAFERAFRVVAWDYRGHGGDKAPPADSVRVANFGADALALLGKLARPGGKAIVVGHSMGVQVALEIYRQAPERVAGLILVCGTYGHPMSVASDSAALRTGVAALARVLRDHPLAALERAIKVGLRKPWAVEGAYVMKAAVRGKPTQQMIHELLEHVAEMDWRVVFGIFADYVEHTAAGILPEVKVPTLVIGGGLDGWAPPAKSEEMGRTIPGAELMLLNGCSHLAHVEEPEPVHARVEAFLRSRGLWPLGGDS